MNDSAYQQCVIDATGHCVRWSHQHEDEMCDPCAEGRHASCDNGYIFCDCCAGSGCDHEWLDRPESDTRECLVCGAER